MSPDTGCSKSIPTPVSEYLEKVTDLDVIFPVLHGTFGEDGTLQGLLEMTDIAYVGAGVLGSSVGMDKATIQRSDARQRIPVVDSILVTRADDPQRHGQSDRAG